ncbi:uncharacterized protein LOC133293028 [Gastrolobium bilobum]|uniref:uncharacterized protein LOC133293028 n=1 Tax=Gastrolobium bilobum TaxID=150636 RepID=UPI002AB0AC45|nr:uncharacterized protein LOC133293028 [Gastrolobium bilobum]
METRARLRVQKKKPIKHRGRKLLLKNFLDYLKSDTFMYAPLVSSLPSDFPSLDTFPSSAKVVELKKPIKESKWFREQVGEYLTSNVYMYDPLLDLPHSPQEPLQDGGMIRMDVSTKTSPMKVNQRTDHLGNVNQRTESHIPQTNVPDEHTWGHKETVKHTVYQSCRSTSDSRVTLNSQLRSHG